MTYAITLKETGAPEVLEWTRVPELAPGRREALVEHAAIGVNALDLAQRRGAVKIPLPGGLGLEAAGRVVSVGPDTPYVKPGDRVVYALGPLGAYAEARLYPADRLIVLPDAMSFDDAASLFFKGLTAHYLIHDTYPVAAGHDILLYGAAGGVGQILARWATSKGARVIGVVSNPASVEQAETAGCRDVLIWGDGDLAHQVRRLTGGRGVDVVYDGVGKDTFDASMDSLRKRGVMVSIGATSGVPDPVPLARLNAASLFLTRPGLADHIADRAEYQDRAADVFEAVRAGVIAPAETVVFPLDRAAAAHRGIEDRTVKGSVLLKPEAGAAEI